MADTARSRVTGVDGMRALAALAVFFCHLVAYWQLADRLPGKLTPLSQLGAHGVDLFVVISGFCLALPVARRAGRLDVRTFFVRRATRILPPYYVALTTCAVLAVLPSTALLVAARPADWRDVLLHATLLQTVVPGQIGTINGSFWSIALEVQLYLLFPLVVLAWRRFGIAPVVVATALLSLVWWALGALHLGVLGDPHVVPDRLVQFCAGMAAAELVARDRVPRRARLWTGVLVGGLAAAVASTAEIEPGRSILWAVPSVCAVLLASGRFRHGVLGIPLERLGLISYSFYLLQQPVLLLTSPAAHRVTDDPWALLLLGSTVCLALVVALSWVMHLLVEAPSIRWGARLTRRPATTPEPPAVPVNL